ncbi:MAG: HAMP domain-containing histidine kinase [Ruminococcus sp.]|jgi:two-component system sensor histidine kinase VanS|nr:HAMP domain-containing histidine kinase [Ruminococcus sp.]
MNKESFSIKIFTGSTCVLLAVGLLVFGILRFFIPKIYEEEATEQITINSQAFVIELESAPKTEWAKLLMQYCLKNNASAVILDENNNQFAAFRAAIVTGNDDYKAENEDAIFTTYTVTIGDRSIPYTMVFTFDSGEIKQVKNTFETIFPLAIFVILIISVFIAFFYTRFLMNIKNLQTANEKLQADIKEERRRRNFFSAISHELKTPVTILKGELDGMILGVGKFKDRDKYLLEAYETTQAIEQLVKEIMTAAKLDIVKLTPEEINLSELTNECLVKIEELTKEKNISVNQKFSDNPITADKKLMEIVISNIIGNAVKHSPQGTEINICFDETFVFTIENHGTHIEETTDDSDISGGLGLYIVKSILDLHGFKYSFENTEDGTRFSINYRISIDKSQ